MLGSWVLGMLSEHSPAALQINPNPKPDESWAATNPGKHNDTPARSGRIWQDLG